MTTVVSNASGRKATKEIKKTNTNKPPTSTPAVTANNVTDTLKNHSEEFRNKGDKFQPTAEQMRIASLMSDKKDENDLKKDIEKIVELTGATKEDAAVALHDCDNDITKAIDMILDGDALDTEWHSTGRKKKTKAQLVVPQATEALTNGNKRSDKPSRATQKGGGGVQSGVTNNNALPAGKSMRGGMSSNKVPRKKDNRQIGGGDGGGGGGGGSGVKPELTSEDGDIFAKANYNSIQGGGGGGGGSDSTVRRGGRRGGSRGGRGAPRGKPLGGGAGRGSRTFMNRGLQNNDGFPNSIETWTNSTADQANKLNNSDDLNTMTVGNWSDIATNEDWSEEDWNGAHVETKVFTPSTKTIPEKEEDNKQINHSGVSTQSNSQSGGPFMPTTASVVAGSNKNTNESETTSQQPTMSAILSGSIKRQSAPAPATAGQALLQQIQQSNATQNANLNAYNLSQYSKTATESIKSLVGLSPSNIIPNELIATNEHSALESNMNAQVNKPPVVVQQQKQQANSQQQQQQQQQQRLKVNTNQRSKIPESAVEMPSNDPISNLSVHFGSLEFGSNTNSFSLGVTDSNLFDSVTNQATNQTKPEIKSAISLLGGTNATGVAVDNSNTSTSFVRPTAANVASVAASTTKPILQNTVLGQGLNESILSQQDHRSVDKTTLSTNSYQASKPVQLQERKPADNYMAYKHYAAANNDNTYSSAYQQVAGSVASNYYGGANQQQVQQQQQTHTPFGVTSTVPVTQSLIAATQQQQHGYNATYNAPVVSSTNQNSNTSSIAKMRDMDNSGSVVAGQQQQPQTVSSVTAANKPYDATSNMGTSLSLMSNPTNTTNVLKNTLTATGKGVHNVPPGVQPTQVLSTPYIMSNTPGMAIPYAYPFDMQFQAQPRDHAYPSYATDVKYTRGSDSDMLPVSSQAPGAVQTPTQTHNQAYMNTYPPGYGLYFGFNFAHQGLYGAAQHPTHTIYPVPQAQTTASAGSAFAKANTAANYGSHSAYNSGYESLNAAVAAQSQDYVNKSYPQQLQQHKQMSGNNSADISANNAQSMYGKTHSISKSYDKQSFQPSTQFNLANTQSAANLNSYPSPYMMPQQAMHHTMASAEQSQQPPGVGVGNQRSLSQSHKGSAANNATYSKFNWS